MGGLPPWPGTFKYVLNLIMSYVMFLLNQLQQTINMK